MTASCWQQRFNLSRPAAFLSGGTVFYKKKKTKLKGSTSTSEWMIRRSFFRFYSRFLGGCKFRNCSNIDGSLWQIPLTWHPLTSIILHSSNPLPGLPHLIPESTKQSSRLGLDGQAQARGISKECFHKWMAHIISLGLHPFIFMFISFIFKNSTGSKC